MEALTPAQLDAIEAAINRMVHHADTPSIVRRYESRLAELLDPATVLALVARARDGGGDAEAENKNTPPTPGGAYEGKDTR